jgi:hypothetical protein
VIVVALIVSLISPMVLGYLTNRARMADKREDWARQDAVAAQAAEAAALLLEQNKQVAETAIETNRKLDVVHVLVNSDMTSSLRAQLVALRGQVVVLHKLMRTDAHDTTDAEMAALEAAESQILVLVDTIAQRDQQQKLIDQA